MRRCAGGSFTTKKAPHKMGLGSKWSFVSKSVWEAEQFRRQGKTGFVSRENSRCTYNPKPGGGNRVSLSK